ncbi:MAG: ATP-binding cassette domain-containing protein [Flavimaricola sp.]|nr:ATP-binding cassette domain-containing protein [Flavimaricola sp.]
MTAALELRGLCKSYPLRDPNGWLPRYRELRVVRDVDLTVESNSIVGLVGESGSGKTTTGMMALRLTEPTAGRILVGGQDITRMEAAALKPFRAKMQVVFQDSYSALDPMFTLAQIVAEPLHVHGRGSAREQTETALDWLERVGLHRSYGSRYPHELSGGQRQRVAIARALVLRPDVLIADEPTSALDVSVKAQIINLLQDLQAEMGLSILFISHDLSVVRSLTDKVAVMFNGRIVEEAATEDIFIRPQHPYTRSLLDAIPVLNPRDRRDRVFRSREDLEADIPRLSAVATGLPPAPTPRLIPHGPGHRYEALVQ